MLRPSLAVLFRVMNAQRIGYTKAFVVKKERSKENIKTSKSKRIKNKSKEGKILLKVYCLSCVSTVPD